MKKYAIMIIALLLFGLILAACTGTETPEEGNDVLMTSAVGTMVSSFFGTQTAMYTPPTPTSLPTNTFLPTPTIQFPTGTLAPTRTATYIYYSPTPSTITPTGTLPTPTINGAALAVGCNNLAFIRDVTVPAGTVLAPNQYFAKTWKVANTGTCDWMYQYTIVSSGGETFGSKYTKIQKRVSVGSWSELTVEMQAPNRPGKFTGYWRLSNGENMFGATLAVSITVSSNPPTDTPEPSTFTPTPVTPSYP